MLEIPVYRSKGTKMADQTQRLQPLPIDTALPEINQALKSNRVALIKAEPGAGKTTRVPQALINITDGEILVIEPRRLAARLSAMRVAEEQKCAVGTKVGYQMRFDHNITSATRIKFITEGLFPRLLQTTPMLDNVGAIVIDEFHERHIQTDVALALVRDLQTRRKDLMLVVMSATLETGPLEKALNAPVFDVPGRTFPVEVEHLPPQSFYDAKDIPLIVKRMLKDPRLGGGNILVFLTGMAEINKAISELNAAGIGKHAEIMPLSATVTALEQKRIFAATKKTKIILSTNVAETSVTLPNITGVLDSGRAKIPTLAPWSGLTSLDIKSIAKASCIQRTGRAGRTAKGVCYRMFSERDFQGRPAFLTPDFCRLDLSQTILDTLKIIHSWGRTTTFVKALPWLSPPDPKLLATSQKALQWMGALDSDGFITEKGLRLATWPLHPRLGALCEKGREKGFESEAIVAAAIINEGGILRRNENAPERGKCDIKYQIDLRERLAKGWDLSHSEERSLDKGAIKKVDNLVKLLSPKSGTNRYTNVSKIPDSIWSEILVSGFCDRVAVARPQKKNSRSRSRGLNFNLCLGRGGALTNSSVVEKAEFILALDAHETQAGNKAMGTAIHLASIIQPATLVNAENSFKEKETLLEWDKKAEEVRKVDIIKYGNIRVGEKKSTLEVEDQQEAKALFLQALQASWPNQFEDKESLDIYHNKLDLLEENNIDHGLPRFESEILELFQETLAESFKSFSELRKTSLGKLITEQLSYEEDSSLNQLCPDAITLANRKRIKIHYEKDKAPHAASRLQDFFGLDASPTVAGGRVAVVLHLLGPNQRAVQISGDLGNFWKKSYKNIRKDLKIRYPKHSWPEDPVKAEPPATRKRR